MTYSSSAPDVVYINSSGLFSTLSPGTAVLTAASQERPETQYTITVTVLDEFSWDYSLPDVEIYVGQTRAAGFSSFGLYNGTTISSGVWTSSDPSVVTASDSDAYGCLLTGESPGTATLTGVIYFAVDTRAGTQTMSDTVSFQVTVSPR